LTQTLIIHVIRTNKIPFLQSRSSWTVLLTGLLVIVIGISLPVSPLAAYLGFTALPPSYWPILALTVIAYGLVTQGVKALLLRRKWI
jgi:P-type Mg2+ transporter